MQSVRQTVIKNEKSVFFISFLFVFDIFWVRLFFTAPELKSSIVHHIIIMNYEYYWNSFKSISFHFFFSLPFFSFIIFVAHSFSTWNTVHFALFRWIVVSNGRLAFLFTGIIFNINHKNRKEKNLECFQMFSLNKVNFFNGRITVSYLMELDISLAKKEHINS